MKQKPEALRPAGPPLLPLPWQQYRVFLWFWHVLYLGALVVILGLKLWNARLALGWREAALAGLVAIQVFLYVGVLMSGRGWPFRAWRLGLYFGGSLLVLVIEVSLERDFQWMAFAYAGQMLGLLPPAASFPGMTLITLGLVLANTSPGDLAAVTMWDVFQVGIPLASWLVMGLFIYRISATSTERARLIRELRAAQEELERAHQREAELAVLRERERLARDLHDNLGHTLVALSVQLEAVQRLYKVDPARAETQVEQMKALTRSSMDALRRSLAGLRAPGLGDQPLGAALQALCVDAGQRAGFSVNCQVDAGAADLAPPVAEVLWTAALEALTNVEKHAGARRVEVRLAVEPRGVLLRVADDGRGLPAEADRQPGHFGLRGMRERIEGLGGTLTVTGDAGTCVEARVPLIG